MAKATVLKTTDRFDLKSIPPKDGEEGGWVELRRMSFGEKQEKDAEAMKMRLNMSGTGRQMTDMNAEVAMINLHATALEFSRCIVDHNLEDSDTGIKLDFRKAADVRRLDPRVGQEISDLIGDMNDFESDAARSVVDDEGK